MNDFVIKDMRKKNSRPRIGTTRKISLTLPDETWEWIQDMIMFGHAKNKSELIRQIIQNAKEQ